MTTPHPEVPAARLVEEWRDHLARIARNLTDFIESDTARRVLARSKDPDLAYSGRTLVEATRATAALESLWQDYLTLSAVVEKASAISRKVAFLSHRDEEVAALLQGPSVRLPSVSVPVERRGLLDPAETTTSATPGEVLASMKNAFAVACEAIARVARAEDETADRVAVIRARVDEIETWQKSNGVDLGLVPGLLMSEAQSDPLAAFEAVDRLEAKFAAIEARREDADLAIARLARGFGAAAATLSRLPEIYRQTAAAISEARTLDHGALPALADDETARLAGWLETLRRTASDGRPVPASVGLGRWNEAAELATAKAAAALLQARAPLSEMVDLRGRFRALRAKGAVLGTLEAAQIEAQAKAELAREPVRLAQLRRLVTAYENALLQPKDLGNGGMP